MKHTRRPRQTPEHIQALVAQFHQSALSSTAFCKKHGIAYSSFYAWCKKYPATKAGAINKPPSSVQFIDLQAMAAPDRGAWNIILKLGNGVELQLSQA